eukprot:gene50286-66872_t
MGCQLQSGPDPAPRTSCPLVPAPASVSVTLRAAPARYRGYVAERVELRLLPPLFVNDACAMCGYAIACAGGCTFALSVPAEAPRLPLEARAWMLAAPRPALLPYAFRCGGHEQVEPGAALSPLRAAGADDARRRARSVAAALGTARAGAALPVLLFLAPANPSPVVMQWGVATGAALGAAAGGGVAAAAAG